jgi:hypothetical protein
LAAPLLVITGMYGFGVVLVHAVVGIPGDTDSVVYASQGNRLLDGDYPDSEYPVGAVLLFGLDALIGGATVLTTHGILMIPFQLAAVSGLWLLRPRRARGRRRSTRSARPTSTSCTCASTPLS